MKPSSDVKNDFQREIKAVFTGGSEVLLKPSEIMKLCEPPHKVATVVEVDIVKPLEEHDKEFYKVKTDGSIS
jgi:hypothetical protein